MTFWAFLGNFNMPPGQKSGKSGLKYFHVVRIAKHDFLSLTCVQMIKNVGTFQNNAISA